MPERLAAWQLELRRCLLFGLLENNSGATCDTRGRLLSGIVSFLMQASTALTSTSDRRAPCGLARAGHCLLGASDVVLAVCRPT